MKKINLKGISEILCERELKNVVGGTRGNTTPAMDEPTEGTDASGEDSCGGGGENNSTCTGSCADRVVWDSAAQTFKRVPRSCLGTTTSTGHGTYYTICGCG